MTEQVEYADGTQLPLERWDDHRMAQAAIELSDEMGKLQRLEKQEAARRKEAKGEIGEQEKKIDGLRGLINEQRAAIVAGINESDEEE